MLFFGITFAAGVIALLAVQKLDIEGVKPSPWHRATPSRKAIIKVSASPSVLGGAVYLRQQ